MKVLYLASRTDEVTTLELEREITALQRTAQTAAVEDVKFVFLPNVRIEQVGLELMRNRPDVLHISVHGKDTGLWFATEHGAYAELTPERLIDLLPDPLPRLIFLNACDSAAAAQILARLPLVAIGSTAPITNQAAIASGTIMYAKLLGGHSIAEAFRATHATVSTLAGATTSLMLCSTTPGLDRRRLLRVPQIAARLPPGGRHKGTQGISAYVGLVGCPGSTTQVCFFTDDPTFLNDDMSVEESQTEVIRDIPRGGEVWTEAMWTGDGDFRVGACGITGDGQTFASSAMFSEALQYYAASVDAPANYRKVLAESLRYLEENRGDGLGEWKVRRRRNSPRATPTPQVRPRRVAAAIAEKADVAPT